MSVGSKVPLAGRLWDRNRPRPLHLAAGKEYFAPGLGSQLDG